ncbi:MAG: hypothetical protein AAF192_18565, partial [Pseudomonadota bacterium]
MNDLHAPDAPDPPAAADAAFAAPDPVARGRVHGLIWDSPRPIPAAAPAPPGAPADVVARADLPPGPVSGRLLGPMWRLGRQGAPLYLKRGFVARLDGPDRIAYAAAPGLSAARIGLELAYGAGAGLLHLRGALPLHAAVVAGPQGAALIL